MIIAHIFNMITQKLKIISCITQNISLNLTIDNQKHAQFLTLENS